MIAIFTRFWLLWIERQILGMNANVIHARTIELSSNKSDINMQKRYCFVLKGTVGASKYISGPSRAALLNISLKNESILFTLFQFFFFYHNSRLTRSIHWKNVSVTYDNQPVLFLYLYHDFSAFIICIMWRGVIHTYVHFYDYFCRY